MFNNRMLAVAAVLVMAVPALGAATPIVVPPVPEQLVEGHTVFTVIEIVRNVANNTTAPTNETRFAAAVAVLVREYDAGYDRTDNRNAQRFPGVLWFNDQYLTNPEQAASRDAVEVAGESFRYPCGGAVLAVNAGDPDPRVSMARVATPTGDEITVGDTNYTYEAADGWAEPDTDYTGDTIDDPYYYGQDSGGPGDAATDYAWIGIKPQGTTDGFGNTVYSDSGNYDESYLITDPNDHSWVIDKYNFYTRTGDVAGGVVYDFPVWAVNILGSPAFLPDLGSENCAPFQDLLDVVPLPVPCGTAVQGGNPLGGADSDITLTPSVGTETDDPCMGYMEPSDNGFCYGGQAAADDDADGDIDADDCTAARDDGTKPFRVYNALLYFKLEDLTIAGAAKDHSDPAASADTNGCADEVHWWDTQAPAGGDFPNTADYECPGGNDDLEGNSHSFHPTTPVHEEREACLPEIGGPNPTNHGGSSGVAPGDPTYADGWYNGEALCGYDHATRNIDIYFSGAGRPMPPVVRNFDVLDLEGSSAPFQDYHAAYP